MFLFPGLHINNGESKCQTAAYNYYLFPLFIIMYYDIIAPDPGTLGLAWPF
jgi:hypothetical protein